LAFVFYDNINTLLTIKGKNNRNKVDFFFSTKLKS